MTAERDALAEPTNKEMDVRIQDWLDSYPETDKVVARQIYREGWAAARAALAAPAQGEPMTAPPREPCPFCGKGDHLIEYHDPRTVLHPWYRIECDYCGAKGPGSDRGDHVDEWNCRAAPAPPVAQPAEWSCKRCGCRAFLRSAKLGMPARECAKCHTVDDSVAQPAEPPATDDLVRRLRSEMFPLVACRTVAVAAADLIERQAREIARLSAELEREQVRLAACGVAAMQNTRKSAKERILPTAWAWSASYSDVCRAVDNEMDARERAERAEAESAALRAENEKLRTACASGWGEPTLINTLRAEVERQAREIAARDTHLESFRIGIRERDATILRLQKSHTQAWNISVRDAERAERAEAERDALREDAERYRWLRDANNWSEEGPMPCVATFDSTIYGTALDAAIDAARAGK